MKLLSWNVNGVRAALRYGLLDYLAREQADVVCLQETRAPVEALAPLMAAGYHVFLNPAERKGYAGVAILSRTNPRAVTYGLGLPEHDQEGRVVTAEFDEFFLVNVYVPNSKNDLARLPYRQRWDLAFLAFLRGLERRKPVIFCGDLNVAHTELDLARPRQNVGTHGFTPEERAGFTAFVQAGFLDSFRVFEPGGGFYTWWSVAAGARARNVGWRIDYFLLSASLQSPAAARVHPPGNHRFGPLPGGDRDRSRAYGFARCVWKNCTIRSSKRTRTTGSGTMCVKLLSGRNSNGRPARNSASLKRKLCRR